MSHRKNTRSSSKASTAKPARYFHIAFSPLYTSLNHVFRGGCGGRGGRGGRGGYMVNIAATGEEPPKVEASQVKIEEPTYWKEKVESSGEKKSGKLCW